MSNLALCFYGIHAYLLGGGGGGGGGGSSITVTL